jgi:hypothetical protein
MFDLDNLTFTPTHVDPKETLSKWYLFFNRIWEQMPDQWIELDQVLDMNHYSQMMGAVKRWGALDKPFEIEYLTKAKHSEEAPDGHKTYGFKMSLKVSKK